MWLPSQPVSKGRSGALGPWPTYFGHPTFLTELDYFTIEIKRGSDPSLELEVRYLRKSYDLPLSMINVQMVIFKTCFDTMLNFQ